jgi:hypothetical protein
VLRTSYPIDVFHLSFNFLLSAVTLDIYIGGQSHREHIFTRDETGLVCLPTQLERTLQLYW